MKQFMMKQFIAIKKLSLSLGHYAITGSGALGIRNLREIGDIDIIVSPELWNTLAAKYGVTDENGVRRVVFPDGVVEAFGDGSFYTAEHDPHAPSIEERIATAEIVEGLPFESLDHVIYYKRKMGREKDLRDILLIEAWRNSHES